MVLREKKKEFYEKNRPIIWIAAVVFLAMLLLNLLTPMIADDYAYCYSFLDGSEIHGLWEVVKSQYAHYHNTNGRVLLHFFAQMSLWLPHILFKVLNSGIYVLLGILMYQHITYGKNQKAHPVLLCLIFICLWLWLPVFGETVLWQDGACNYLWGTVVILAFLLPYRMYYSNPNLFQKNKWILIMFLAGVMAGACNENTSAAACMAAGLFLLRYGISKHRIPSWSLAGLAGGILGFGFMILAPANLSRAQYMVSVGEDTFLHVDSFRDLYVKFMWISKDIGELAGSWLVFLTIFLGAYLIFQNHSFQKMELPVIYLACMLAGMYAMIIPPALPERTYFGPVVFWIIGLGEMLLYLEIRRDGAVTMALLTCLLSVVAVQYLEGLKQNVLVYRQLYTRDAYIHEQKAQGNLDLSFDYIEPHGRYCAWWDMKKDPAHYYNAKFARYYGLSSVTVPDSPEIKD